jgi:flagellar M-ring protein FliF
MDFKELFTQLSGAFLKLDRIKQVIISLSLFAVIGFLIFLIIISTSEDKSYAYKSLFESVPYTEAGQIVDILKKNEIQYAIQDKGGNMATIKVANEDLPNARMLVSSVGLPKDTRVGFEIFNNQEFGATDFDQKIKYLRAMEGELAKTIEKLEPVVNATVHIALPQESLFVAKQVNPTASVVLNLHENMVLLPRQIKGIKHLVASAVPKLSPDDVTIVNTFGEPLGDNDEMVASTEEAKNQMTYKNRYEKAYENKIIEVLAPFIGGTDRVVAKVTIDFDFSKEESQREQFDPESVVRSEQSVDETREGSTPKDIGGVPGAVSNVGAVQGMNDAGKEKYEKSKATTNYEISKTVSSKKAEFSRIKRVTAAVVVDGTYAKDNEGKYVYSSLTDEQIKQIKELVVGAIGINNSRGDEVSVRNFQFKSIKDMLEQKVEMSNWMDKFTQHMPIKDLVKYILAFIILYIFYRQVIKPFAVKMLEEVKEDEQPINLEFNKNENIDEDLTEKYTAMKKNIEVSLGLHEGINEDQVKYEILVEQISKYISEHTDEVSNLLQLLLEEEVSLSSKENKETFSSSKR